MNKELKIKVPTSLEDITVKQFTEYRQFVEVAENITQSDIDIKTISLFCNLPLNIVHSMDFNDITEIASEIQGLFEENKEIKMTKIIKIGKTEYGFIPNLEEISMGEFVDIDEFLGKEDRLADLLAIFYRPITKKAKWWQKSTLYSIEKYETSSKYVNEMDNAPVSVAIATLSFITHLGEELLKSVAHTLSKEEIPTEHYQVLQDLVENGVGINNFAFSLKTA